ncbi:CPBP family intramembrane glutamic endopeptidase [Ruegeria arenilitoris]|uniref:CPBP family intramembrane glutamic endopeptidase n=1 Tax=Ruegeria arenilitoris TaxID=1173585 RepID=UPI00147E2449|nr:CPBP family intramembrane glutamic endopeptidase [Ruegeria arenilitoris]
MALFLALLPTIWPWLILVLSQIFALSGQRLLSLVMLLLFGFVTTTLGLITLPGLLIATLGLIGASYLPRLKGLAAILGHLALIIWSLALGAHLMPGFNNLLVLDQVNAGPDSGPFTMYLNLDKPIVFFAVLLACPMIINGAIPTRRLPLIIGILLLPALFLLGATSGAVRPELGLPAWWMIFAFSNLFLTSLTEEAFFRGYLQSVLTTKTGPAIGITLASILFGLVHFGGGPALVLFASILGLACGLGYYATGRLWVPTLMHFGFNFTHLALFTYPGPA